MSKIERNEYKEMKIMRTASPSRHRSSTQNLTEFDSNLDYLLEDLQNSVSRPASALGHSIMTDVETVRSVNTMENGKSASLSRISNVKPLNPVADYSSGDVHSYTGTDGKSNYSGYKKESYSYKTSVNGTPMQTEKTTVLRENNINQLDSLLDDLKQVKQSPLLNDPYHNAGIDSTFSNSQVTSIKHSGVAHNEGPTRSRSRDRTLERTSEREYAESKDVKYIREGTYGNINQLQPTSGSPSRTSTLSKQTAVSNIHAYPMEVIETTAPDINPEILEHLDPHLRPPGNTKVTTTIKTYTYEIPGSGDYPTSVDTTLSDTESYNYSPNKSQTTPSKSFVYKKLVDKSMEDQVEYFQTSPPPPPPSTKIIHKQSSDISNTYYEPPYQKPPPPTGSTMVKEVITTRNYQPVRSPELNSSNQTYVYNETTTTRNVDANGYPIHDVDIPISPPRNERYIKEIHNTNVNINKQYPEEPIYPQKLTSPIPAHETHIIKETHHNKITNVGYPHPPPNGYPYQPKGPNEVSTVIYKEEKHATSNVHGPGGPRIPNNDDNPDFTHPPYPKPGQREPNDSVNIKYKYVSNSSTTDKYRTGYQPRREDEPLLPKPFPTDQSDGPPKKLDELMATIGHEPANSPLNAGYSQHEQELMHQKKVETLKRQDQEKQSEVELLQKNTAQRTKNVSGPPVYYPPGHEMFAKKEESEAAWRAQGAYARESGKYEYGSESGSKVKTRSGAAVVPVCLPLCCGLPCVIL